MRNEMRSKIVGAAVRALIACVLMLCALFASTYAWYFSKKEIASYAPISTPESLYIGAGHRDIANDTFEDIRYLYFEEMDATHENYVDKVFCIYGKGVPSYKIQLAYTTNNPFTYSIYHATESLSSSNGAVHCPTHQNPSVDYYYSINGAEIGGTFINKQVVNGETIATNGKHTETYGSYANVQKNAEPIYWQTSSAEVGNNRSDFVNYYIIRVWKNGKSTNDRETDILCIAAKAFSQS